MENSDPQRILYVENRLTKLRALLEEHNQCAEESGDEFHYNMCEAILYDIQNYEEELQTLTDLAA